MQRFAGKALAFIALFLIVALAGAWIGHKVSESHHLEKISTLESSLAQAKSAQKLSEDLSDRFEQYCGAIDAAAAKQGEAIAELGRQADAHKAAVAAATAQARKDSAQFQREAASIIASQPPPGENACDAASADFDNELRTERSGGAK